VLASAVGAQSAAPAAAAAAAPKSSRPPPSLLGPIDLLFLGTCSSAPSSTRNQQSAALRVGGDTWLFDCGESTQRQMLFAKWRTSSITRVFITHMHGDHVFGARARNVHVARARARAAARACCRPCAHAHLCAPARPNFQNRVITRPPLPSAGLPGILCNVGSACGEGKHHVTIVGPPGLRAWLRCTLMATYSTLGASTTYSVHELIGMQATSATSAAGADAASANAASEPASAPTALQPERLGQPTAALEPLHVSERPGVDLAPDARGVWTLPRAQTDPPMQVRREALAGGDAQFARRASAVTPGWPPVSVPI
jgi:ribonuclease BN (tRNA processing enzyme)